MGNERIVEFLCRGIERSGGHIVVLVFVYLSFRMSVLNLM